MGEIMITYCTSMAFSNFSILHVIRNFPQSWQSLAEKEIDLYIQVTKMKEMQQIAMKM